MTNAKPSVSWNWFTCRCGCAFSSHKGELLHRGGLMGVKCVICLKCDYWNGWYSNIILQDANSERRRLLGDLE